MKMRKHSFGQSVFCKECGSSVPAVWAESYELARTGHGLCDECYNKPKPVLSSKLPRSKTKDEQPQETPDFTMGGDEPAGP